MYQISYTNQGSGIAFPVTLNPGGMWTVVSAFIMNGTAATVTVSDLSGVAYITMLPYTQINLPTPNINGLKIATNGAVIQATDVLNVIAFDYNTTIQSSGFGPSIFGGGADFSSLQKVIPGTAITAPQLNQYFNLLQGLIVGTIDIAGPIAVSGATGQLRFYDQDGVGGDFFDWFANVGAARLFSSVLAGNVLIVDEAGNLLVTRRVSSSNTGASGQTLLNFVPIAPTQTTVTGTGNAAPTSFTVNGLPTSAIAASGHVLLASNSAGCTATMGRSGDTDEGWIVVSGGGGVNGAMGSVSPVDAGATNQLTYRVFGTGGLFWDFIFTLTGYWEAS